jgi:glucose-1-phosphate cytidylyltransferase
MKIYSCFGFTDFIICLGHKGYMIKEFFSSYLLRLSDVTFDLANDRVEVHRRISEPWRVTLIETGDGTQTGGRLKRVLPYVGNDDVFAMTYGDSVANIDLNAELQFHRDHGRLATLAAVRPAKRFGVLDVDQGRVVGFAEKPEDEGGWINGGFFFLSPEVWNFIAGDDTAWEQDPLKALVAKDQLRAYHHCGFWHPMDTLRDKVYLEQLWTSGRAEWMIW